MRQIIVAGNGGSAWIPDDEPETDHETLIAKYWDRIEWDVEEAWIED